MDPTIHFVAMALSPIERCCYWQLWRASRVLRSPFMPSCSGSATNPQFLKICQPGVLLVLPLRHFAYRNLSTTTIEVTRALYTGCEDAAHGGPGDTIPAQAPSLI